MSFAPEEPSTLTVTGPPAEPPASPVVSKRSPGPRVIAAVAVVAVLAAVASVAGAATFDSAPQVPDRWDPRIARIADFVAGARHLDFKHPVRVYFLSGAEYSRAINGAPQGARTAADRSDERRSTEFKRAIGFVEGAPDLAGAQDSLADSGTLAYYDIEKKVVNVRGTALSANTRVTLAHELTHALQDQYFDLDIGSSTTTSEQDTALRTIVEGDAMTVEDLYIAQLSDADRAAYEKEYGTASDQATSDLAEVATPLQASQAIPYAIGRPYVAWVETGSQAEPNPARLDDVMAHPPKDTAATFNPIEASAHRVRVKTPTAPSDVYLTDQIGAYSLFIMLSDRIDPVVAMDAVDGWRGDSFVAAERSVRGRSTMCVTADFAMASDRDATELDAALGAWAEVMPAEAGIGHSATGRAVTLRTCDPGPKATARGPIGKSSDALVYPSNRIDIAAVLAQEGVAPKLAWCLANRTVRQLTPGELSGSDVTPQRQTEIRDLIAAAHDVC